MLQHVYHPYQMAFENKKMGGKDKKKKQEEPMKKRMNDAMRAECGDVRGWYGGEDSLPMRGPDIQLIAVTISNIDDTK